ncbi:MAG: GUN4 domain-containing protein [Aphanocapsa feldmannii 277cV]|uniref:GUN4 domain-containing protein n=2 Tax=Aphanocapsa feldmannii TaxID=192050 RepID=A0A524RLC6_9CHRO|nr:MAG: GUN4 domain-containing protein [Aphanocapsa feldmannii 288cV]TGG90842.1 MAG: GUN4 domain-containing protein [Aphanocapsa feldmannii 277cV]TGH22667.1 MAG: GUN4 domain-containing protein [Aphanocapsa feldmannii 277cI]
MLSGTPLRKSESPEEQLKAFRLASSRQRHRLLEALLAAPEPLLPSIAVALDDYDPSGDDWAAGALIQLLMTSAGAEAEAFRQRHPHGWLLLGSAVGIDYGPLQLALARQDFEQADRVTMTLLRHLAGPDAETRGYVFYSEVPGLPEADLDTIDRLWVTYSRGRFGFSVQRRLLAVHGGRWDSLWKRIGWKGASGWTRYPGAFTWNHAAPEGHMPLVNQLRGVRLMDALLSHPAISKRATKSPA